MKGLLLAGSMLALAAGAQAAESPRPTAVTVQVGEERDLLADAMGKALYTYDMDRASGITCVGACASAWPPLLAAANDKPVGDWTVVVRPEGAQQWAFRGKPVYRFSRDSAPGVASGDAIANWHAVESMPPLPVLNAPPAISVGRLGKTYVLADLRGMTLYTFDRDRTPANPACRADCQEVWPPVLGPSIARPVGAWTPVDRPDGVRQWAYQNRLVYTYTGDQKAGEAAGQDAGGAWRAIAFH